MTKIPLCRWVAHLSMTGIDAVGGAPVPPNSTIGWTETTRYKKQECFLMFFGFNA